MFHDRQDAGFRLAEKVKAKSLKDPLILAIPRGGVVVGAVLAQELNAELDVVLSRKLRAPAQPELAIGAIAEDGAIYVNPRLGSLIETGSAYLKQECRHQFAEIARRRKLFRAIRPAVRIEARSVIVTDDGIATGSTMIAALQVVKSQRPRELIVAVPVASPERLVEVSEWCDTVICLHSSESFYAIGLFYDDFSQVSDDQVAEAPSKRKS